MAKDNSLDSILEEARARADEASRIAREGEIRLQKRMVWGYFEDLRAVRDVTVHKSEPEYEEVSGGWGSSNIMKVPTGRSESVAVDETVTDYDGVISGRRKVLKLFRETEHSEVRDYIKEEAEKIDRERGDRYYSGLVLRVEAEIE